MQFWSSDSRSVAFFATNGQLVQLKRIPATGGPARVICDTPSFDPSIPTDGTWRGGVILFTTSGPISRVAATGGTATTLETLPWKPGQRRYASVQLLPDGHHLLFALASSGYIAVGVMFEERDLRRTFGESYEAYAARVPALLPGLPRRRDRARSLTV